MHTNIFTAKQSIDRGQNSTLGYSSTVKVQITSKCEVASVVFIFINI